MRYATLTAIVIAVFVSLTFVFVRDEHAASRKVMTVKSGARLSTADHKSHNDTVIPPNVSNIQFGSASYSVDENAGFATITVTRTSSGTDTDTVTVDYNTMDGEALQRTDYSFASGTLTFAPGELEKTFTVLIVNDSYQQGYHKLNLILSNPGGLSALGNQSAAELVIADDDLIAPTDNPIDQPLFFVQQHYYDFFSRTPDPSGLDYWSQQISQCGLDPECIHNKRVDVSNAFLYEREFQETGSYVYRVYKMAFATRPTYNRFMTDRGRVIGGPQLDQSKSAFADAFVNRPEFLEKYPSSLVPDAFVEALNSNTGNMLDASECDQLADGIVAGTETRATVLRKMADNQKFIDVEYNSAFALMQYFGYLRRDPDPEGFDFWLGQLNRFPIRDLSAQHAMVCSFITSREYQERFSPVVNHDNRECPQ